MDDRRTLRRRLWLLAAAGLALAALGAPASGQDRPNVLFIMTDQQQPDAMSCRMGSRYLHTPAMDSLARSGMVFTRAYTPNPLCMPARASLFTGRYPHQTGVTVNGKAHMDPDAFTCMGRVFRRAGYEAAYCGKWHLAFSQGDSAEHGFEMLKAKAADGRRDSNTAEAAVRFLRAEHPRPFLLVVSFLGPHDACQLARGEPLPCGPIGDPPPLAECPPAPANWAPPVDETDSMAVMRKSYHNTRTFPVGGFTPDDWRRFRWGYYRVVERVDAQIAKVLDALRQSGQEEETVVVLLSDHGECAGAHRWNQKTVFYEESARVPLIISWKGRTAAGSADQLVNTGLDLLPTLCDFAGIPAPAGLPGRSVKPIALGRPPASWRDFVVVQNHMVQGGPVGGMQPTLQGRMVRSERFKYCVYDFGRRREALFDLEDDPLETKNLARDPAHRDVVLQHRRLLQSYAAEQKDPLVEQLLADDVAPRPFR